MMGNRAPRLEHGGRACVLFFLFVFVGWFWGTLVCAVVEIMAARFLIPGFVAGLENAWIQRGLYLVPY